MRGAARQYLASDVIDLDEVREILKRRERRSVPRQCHGAADSRADQGRVPRAGAAGHRQRYFRTEASTGARQRARARHRADPAGGVTLPRVNGDAVQIQQLLLERAAQRLRCRGLGECLGSGTPREVTVITRVEDGMVQIAVRDSGAGVDLGRPRAHLRAIRHLEAAGHGAWAQSISRAIAARHGGTPEAWNNADRGMTFQFSLPSGGHAHTARRAHAAGMPWPNRLSKDSAMSEHVPTVYIVDDDPGVVRAGAAGQGARLRGGGLRRCLGLPRRRAADPGPACVMLDLPDAGHGRYRAPAPARRRAAGRLVTGPAADVPSTILAMLAGATDFLLKPVRKTRCWRRSNGPAAAPWRATWSMRKWPACASGWSA